MAAVWTFDQPAKGVGTGVPSDRLPICCPLVGAWSVAADQSVWKVVHVMV